MKVIALYQPKSEHATPVESFAHDFKQADQTRNIDLVDVDSVPGSAMAQLYDITQYPALLVTKDDGQLLTFWQGPQLPLMNEVAAYLHS